MLSGFLGFFDSNIYAQEVTNELPDGVETHLIVNYSDYKLYELEHIENLPKYNTESLTEFHMPIVYKIPLSIKLDIKKFIKQGLFLNTDKNFNDRLRDSGYTVYGNIKPDEYFVVDYWIKIKASDKPFSVDFIPKIELENKDYELKQYAWWNSSWNYTKYADVCDNITDYTIKLTVGYSSGGDVNCSGNCQTDFEDIRFTKGDNTTELHHWIQSCTSGVSAVFWVNVSNADSICMYYGNDVAITSSSGVSTFLFWEGDGASASNWVAQGDTGSVSDSGDWLKFDSTSISAREFELREVYFYNHTSNFIIETDFKKHGTAGNSNMVLIPDDGTTPFDDDFTSVVAFYNKKTGNLGFWCYNGVVYFQWSNTQGDLQVYDLQVHVNLTNDKSDFWLDGEQKTDLLASGGKWCGFREDNEISFLSGLYVTVDDNDDLYFKHLRTRLWTLGTEPSFCNWSIEYEQPPICECLVTNPNPTNNSNDVSLFFNNITVAINSTCGILDWVNISFLNCYRNVSTSLTNGTYYLNFSGCSNLTQLTTYTWYVNASCNGTINHTYFNFTTVASGCQCIDELTAIYNEIKKTNKILEGDQIIEIETTQFVIIIQIILFCIFMWIGYIIPSLEGSTKSLHYIPFSGGLFVMFGALDFISLAILLTTNYSLGIIGGFLITIGIILLIYGVLKAFYYE
jgi:hypothetical protein